MADVEKIEYSTNGQRPPLAGAQRVTIASPSPLYVGISHGSGESD